MRLFVIVIFLIVGCQDEKRSPVILIEQETVDTIPPAVFPPIVKADYDTTIWFEVLNSEQVQLKLLYAQKDNFTGTSLYSCPRCFLHKSIQQPFLELLQNLEQHQKGLVVFDCYRPLSVQQAMWNHTPNPTYVTNPKKGSMHNRGLALDIGLCVDGHELDMGSEFDSFGPQSHWDYPHSETISESRLILKEACEQAGFQPIRTEWWHFSYRKSKAPVSDFIWSCKTSNRPQR